PIDKIDDVIPSPFSVGGDLPGEIRALNGNRRNEPCRQSAQCKKRNGEKQRNGLGPSKRSARHFRHERIEQIRKNCGDRNRDQNWLEKTNDAGAGPDHGGKDDDKNDDETGSQRRPHHLALPRRGVVVHLSTSSNVGRHPAAAVTWTSALGLSVRYSMFDVSALVRWHWSFSVNLCR